MLFKTDFIKIYYKWSHYRFVILLGRNITFKVNFTWTFCSRYM